MATMAACPGLATRTVVLAVRGESSSVGTAPHDDAGAEPRKAVATPSLLIPCGETASGVFSQYCEATALDAPNMLVIGSLT
jgi:hypothetical protein